MTGMEVAIDKALCAAAKDIVDGVQALLKEEKDCESKTDEEYRDLREFNRGVIAATAVIVDYFENNGIMVPDA